MQYPSDTDVLAALRVVGARDAEGWAPHIGAACRAHGIDTPKRLALFLAQCSHETGGFKTLVESLNYSVQGLRATFGEHRISGGDCARLGRRPGERRVPEARQREIANLIYGGEWGRKNLGNTQPNDGYFFRGKGLIQLTGRANHTKFAKAIGVDVVSLQAMLETKQGAAESAARFWAAKGVNAFADRGDVAGARRLVNGGELGLDEVEGANAVLLASLEARGGSALA